jgi:hypothetical protein
MRIFKDLNKRRLMIAFAGGALCLCFFKLYLYINNRKQFDDSNALISLVFAFIATVFIFLMLGLISSRNSSK